MGMSSDSSHFKPPRRDQINPAKIYGNKVGAVLLAEQQIEAATRELRERFDLAEADPDDRQSVTEAVGYAWRIMTFLGFPDFDQLRSVRTEDLPAVIEENQHAMVALALETIGWHQYGLRRYDIDRTARVFDRCLTLAPHNQRALERFAIVANEIQPEHIGGLAKFPKKQQETAIGYKLQCKRKVDNILNDVFGITEAHLVGQTDPSVAEMFKTLKEGDRRFVFNMLGHLAHMNCVIGNFFENGTMLSLGMGAACCQLEILGLPRDLHNLIPLCTSRLDEDNSGQVAGEETPILCDILRNIKAICEAKWRIFNNEGAEQRVLEINTLLERIEGA